VSRQLAWVVGAGGLLGSHLVRRLSQSDQVSLWRDAQRLTWRDRELLNAQLDREASRFADAIAAGAHQSWGLFWAAGAGVVATAAADLDAESATFEHALQRLAAHLARARVSRPGCVFLASSAGGVYAGTTDLPATEHSAAATRSAYGAAKLRQEESLQRWAADAGVSCLIGRIANLYGPGQNLRKPQGLISHLARSLILGHPAHVYVPLDTVRDYLHVDDCARGVAEAMAKLADEAIGRGPTRLTKIFASEQPASVAVIMGIFYRLARRRPRIIQATRPEARLQPRCLAFRSVVWPEIARARIGLPVGIRETYDDVMDQYRRGALVA